MDAAKRSMLPLCLRPYRRHPDLAKERELRDTEEKAKLKAEARAKAKAEKELADARQVTWSCFLFHRDHDVLRCDSGASSTRVVHAV